MQAHPDMHDGLRPRPLTWVQMAAAAEGLPFWNLAAVSLGLTALLMHPPSASWNTIARLGSTSVAFLELGGGKPRVDHLEDASLVGAVADDAQQ